MEDKISIYMFEKSFRLVNEKTEEEFLITDEFFEKLKTIVSELEKLRKMGISKIVLDSKIRFKED